MCKLCEYNSKSDGEISEGNIEIAGIAGSNNGNTETIGKIIDCLNIGQINANGGKITYMGGIAGVSAMSIINCTNDGSLNVESLGRINIGGIVGTSDRTTATIENCKNNNNIKAKTISADDILFVGGIVGSFKGKIINCYNKGKLTASRKGVEEKTNDISGNDGEIIYTK